MHTTLNKLSICQIFNQEKRDLWSSTRSSLHGAGSLLMFVGSDSDFSWWTVFLSGPSCNCLWNRYSSSRIFCGPSAFQCSHDTWLQSLPLASVFWFLPMLTLLSTTANWVLETMDAYSNSSRLGQYFRIMEWYVFNALMWQKKSSWRMSRRISFSVTTFSKGCICLAVLIQPFLFPYTIRAQLGCPHCFTIFPGKVCLLEMWKSRFLNVSSSLSGSPSACREQYQIWLQMEGIHGLTLFSSFFGCMAKIFFLIDFERCQTSNWCFLSLWSVADPDMSVCNQNSNGKICSLNLCKGPLKSY